MGPLLRDSYQGADTMVWLAAAEEPLRSSGVLWLDRHPRHKNKVPLDDHWAGAICRALGLRRAPHVTDTAVTSCLLRGVPEPPTCG